MKRASSKFLLFSLLCFLHSVFCFGQKESNIGYKGFDLIAGYQFQKYHTVEFGVGYGNRGEEMAAMAYGNIHLTSEFLFRHQENNIYGLKSGFSLAFAFFDCAGQVLYYSDFKGNSCFAIRPEIGLSNMGFIDLNIGRNFVLNGQTNLGLNSYVFILRFTIGQTSKHVLFD